MTSATSLSCGPCNYDGEAKEPISWCTKCKEGLCDDCVKAHKKNKTSRNHQIISIEDFHKITQLSISETCEHHAEELIWFCKTHDKALCLACIPIDHKSCKIIQISAASTNANRLSDFSDLEKEIKRTLRYARKCITNRESAVSNIEEQESSIYRTILDTRETINNHLDMLQKKLLSILASKSNGCKKEHTKNLLKFQSSEKTLIKLEQQTLLMKQFSSDIQVFLGTRKFKKEVVDEMNSIMCVVATTKDYNVNIVLHNLMEKISKEIKEFGQIMVEECTSSLNFKDIIIDLHQIEIPLTLQKKISDTKIQLIKTFQMKTRGYGMNIRSCVILPNGNLLMANFTKEKLLIEYKETGELVRNIPVANQPYAIAVVDSDRIAVTYGLANFLEIINLNPVHVDKTTRLDGHCWGVSQEDGRLYVRVGNREIKVLDQLGRLLEAFKIASDDVIYITNIKDRIIYTDFITNTIHCSRLNGEELWQYKSESIEFADGVAVDNTYNVYVVGNKSNNLTIIRHDGKQCRTMLGKSDGFDKPRSVYYDKEKRKILICNETKAAIFNSCEHHCLFVPVFFLNKVLKHFMNHVNRFHSRETLLF